MSGQLGELVVSLSADIARFRDDLGKATQIAEDKSKKMADSFKNIGAGLAAGLSVGAFVALAKQSLEVSDNISKASQKIGIATETLSGLRYAAQLADVDFESLTSGLGKFNKSIVEAVGGAEKQEQAFRLLGITQEELKKNSPDEVFSKVAEGMAGMADGANKTALAMALFGKAGANMIPLLNSGAEGLKQATDEAGKFGRIINDEAGKQAEQFNDNLTRMTSGLEGIVSQVVMNNLPMMVKLSDAMVGLAKDSDAVKTASDSIAAGMKTVSTVGVVAFGLFKDAGDRIASVAAALSFAAQGEMKKAWYAIANGGADSVENVKKTADRIKKIWDDTVTAKDAATGAGKGGKGGKGNGSFLGEQEKEAQLLATVTDKRLAYLKAAGLTEAELVKTAAQAQIEINRQSYEWGLQDLQSYLDTKHRLLEKEIEDEIALKKTEVDRYNTESAKFSGSGDAKTQAERYEAMTKEQAAKKDLVALEGKLKLVRLESAEENKKLFVEQTAGYAALRVEMLELAGDFEEAERRKQDEYRKTSDFLKLQAAALAGNAEAWQAMMDLEKKESVAMIEAQSKKNQLVEQYAENIADLQDEIDKWMGKDAQLLTVEQQMRDAVSSQKDIQLKLNAAQSAGRAADIAYYTQKLQMQDILNQRMQKELDLLQRRRVLSGEVVGFNNGVAIERDAYQRQIDATGYISDSALVSNSNSQTNSMSVRIDNISVQGGSTANATGQNIAAEIRNGVQSYQFQMMQPVTF